MDEVRLIEVKEDILSDNKAQADGLRISLKAEKSFLMNLMSSPGAGKTTLLMKSIAKIKDDVKVGVMEADIDSKVDAEKLVAQGISAIQLRTGGFCHLDANMVTKGLEAMDVKGLDLIIIENVGNLVCPAEFDTGAVLNVMLLSVPEGDDKPLKYPLMFTVCDVLIVTKMDYLSLSDFDLNAVRERAKKLNPNIKIFEVSAKTGEGLDDWTDWLKNEVTTFGK
ncbi:MAG: hydrogenase nickel incorporation protein HypB [Deltaproteobacteria bacterium]|jgi:hydrogenase nickel incorporation protein HypB|nr:hydrogenase nickel incorporation protein HypB [Deltaproteobacteria bacterium]MBT4090607.1 hydrogenase nickel incorporation protein HypB [Deltaproteobacteria bacterium]MBT4263209.1 hydrogenase nickel incorporation protein HypB [Deltaproteobacteria bacterium]MBT4640957.1 hydrogenase nickel incorporation protein HypB [Deltaproteobacteria bacterium]MBT6501824.1 hydrogenase nickel incorporation protein HypB [Deltaproteobacteria bacterium]